VISLTARHSCFFERLVDRGLADTQQTGRGLDGQPLGQTAQDRFFGLGRGDTRVRARRERALTGAATAAGGAPTVGAVTDDRVGLLAEWAAGDVGDHIANSLP